MLLLAVVISGCSSGPSLLRLECTGESVHRAPVFDRQTGKLYRHVQPDDVYAPQPVDRFTMKTKGLIVGNSFVIETRVGEWSKKDGERVFTALTPPVGSDFLVELTTLNTTPMSLPMRNGKHVFAPKFGECKMLPLVTHSLNEK